MDEKSGSKETHTRPARLLNFHEIPTWRRENEYLLSGYRTPVESVAACFLGSLRWHNETVNVLLHLSGSCFFAALPWSFRKHIFANVPGAQPIDLVLVTVYLLGVATCFACSACCHALWNHSRAMALCGNRLDFLGIILLMWSASLPSIHYAFVCHPRWRAFHWSLMTFLAVGCVLVTQHPRFSAPHYRSFRASLFTGFGLAGLLFVAHAVLMFGLEVAWRKLALGWMLIMALTNLVGAGAYAARIPERFFPFTFDLLGASHQVFHLAVVLAGLAHYVGLIEAFRESWRPENECSLS